MSPSGSRSRRGSARGRARCPRPTRRGRAAARRRAARSASRRARPLRPRRRSGSASMAFRRRARPSDARAPRRRRPRRLPAFISAALSSSLPSSNAPSSCACEEIALQACGYYGDGVHRHHLEPLPWARLPARPQPLHLALAVAADQRAQCHPHPGEPRTARRVQLDAGRSRVGRGAAAGVPAALLRRRSPGQRRRSRIVC